MICRRGDTALRARRASRPAPGVPVDLRRRRHGRPRGDARARDRSRCARRSISFGIAGGLDAALQAGHVRRSARDVVDAAAHIRRPDAALDATHRRHGHRAQIDRHRRQRRPVVTKRTRPTARRDRRGGGRHGIACRRASRRAWRCRSRRPRRCRSGDRALAAGGARRLRPDGAIDIDGRAAAPSHAPQFAAAQVDRGVRVARARLPSPREADRTSGRCAPTRPARARCARRDSWLLRRFGSAWLSGSRSELLARHV